eukprot:8978204-Pyramimonas_sp.AAC.2
MPRARWCSGFRNANPTVKHGGSFAVVNFDHRGAPNSRPIGATRVRSTREKTKQFNERPLNGTAVAHDAIPKYGNS